MLIPSFCCTRVPNLESVKHLSLANIRATVRHTFHRHLQNLKPSRVITPIAQPNTAPRTRITEHWKKGKKRRTRETSNPSRKASSCRPDRVEHLSNLSISIQKISIYTTQRPCRHKFSGKSLPLIIIVVKRGPVTFNLLAALVAPTPPKPWVSSS